MLPSLAVDCAKIANTSRVRLFVYIDRAPGAFAALQKAVKAAAGQMSLFGGAGGVSEPKPPAGHATVHKTIDVRGHTRQTEHGIVVVPSHQRVIEAAPEEIPATPMHRDVDTGKGPPVRMLQVFPDGSGATGLVDHMGHTWGFNTGRFGQDKAHLVGGPSAHGNRAVNMRDSSLAQAAAAYRRAVDAHVTPELRAANTTMFDQHEAAKAAAAAPPKPAEPPSERPFWDNHFSDYNEARATAQTRANSRGIPMAIRKASKYDKPGYIVSSASSNDSDFAVAEIVRPDPLVTPLLPGYAAGVEQTTGGSMPTTTTRTRQWDRKPGKDQHVRVGDVMQTKGTDGTDPSHYVTVTKTEAPSHHTDGLSMGMRHDDGYAQAYTTRPATAEEAAGGIAAAQAKAAEAATKAKADDDVRVALDSLKGSVRTESRPPGATTAAWSTVARSDRQHVERATIDGQEVYRWTSTGDDYRETYFLPASQADAEAARERLRLLTHWASEHSDGILPDGTYPHTMTSAPYNVEHDVRHARENATMLAAATTPEEIALRDAAIARGQRTRAARLAIDAVEEAGIATPDLVSQIPADGSHFARPNDPRRDAHWLRPYIEAARATGRPVNALVGEAIKHIVPPIDSRTGSPIGRPYQPPAPVVRAFGGEKFEVGHPTHEWRALDKLAARHPDSVPEIDAARAELVRRTATAPYFDGTSVAREVAGMDAATHPPGYAAAMAAAHYAAHPAKLAKLPKKAQAALTPLVSAV